jgi:predicted porin
VALGRQTTAVETAWGIGAAGATNNAVGALYTSGMKMNNTRSSELITYMSPEMSGFKAAVQYGKGETDVTGTAGDLNHKEVGFNVTYANGPLNVGLGYSKESGEDSGADVNNAKQIVLGANYDFGVLKLFGTYMNGSNDDAGVDKVKGWELGLNAPVGPVVLVASYYDGKTETTANVDADRNGYQLGVLYPLSKRTIVYGLYGNDEADIDSANNSETTQVAIGIRHDF